VKYVIMFASTPELDAAVPAERAEEVYRQVYVWFEEHGDKFADSGAELQPVTTATTVKNAATAPVVVDGPFSEAKEVIGGFSVLEVPDLDAAIALVKSWPLLQLPGNSVEIRPMVVDYSQFEA
jgi:hypothetical protein